MPQDEIKLILQRLNALEKAVFGSAQNTTSVELQHPSAEDKDSGVRGGIRKLHREGMFAAKQDLGAVRSALAEQGYHYSRQAVHEALSNFSKSGGLLVALKERGRKVYVARK